MRITSNFPAMPDWTKLPHMARTRPTFRHEVGSSGSGIRLSSAGVPGESTGTNQVLRGVREHCPTGLGRSRDPDSEPYEVYCENQVETDERFRASGDYQAFAHW